MNKDMTTSWEILPSLPNKRKNSISDSKSEYFDIDLQTEG